MLIPEGWMIDCPPYIPNTMYKRDVNTGHWQLETGFEVAESKQTIDNGKFQQDIDNAQK